MIFTQNSKIFSYIFPAAAIAAAMAAVWFFFGHTLCCFRGVLGIPCPGCGLTRAFVSFFRGDAASAFRYHPLFPLIPFIAAVILFRRKKFFSGIYRSTALWGMVLAVFLSVYFYRMLTLFPSIEPMTVNDASMICRIYRFVVRSILL